MAIDYASIGLRIRHARNRQKMTQEQLAELLDVSRTQIGYLETGERGISLELLVDVANCLHAPVEELLIDNLEDTDGNADSELSYLLLDCTEQEERIITKTAQALKSVLSEQGI